MAVSYASPQLSMCSISSPGGFSHTRTSISACSFSSPRLRKASASSSSFLSGSFSLLPLHLNRPVRRGMDSWSFSILALNMEEAKPKVTRKVYLEISIPNQDGTPEEKQKVVIGLYGEDVPQSTKQFRDLCINKAKGVGYKGSTFSKNHTAIKAGSLPIGNEGNMLMSSTKPPMRNRSFGTEERKEDRKGLDFSPDRGAVCMVDPNKISGTEFFICTDETPEWKGKHVVFGKVLTDMKFVDRISSALESNKTAEISDCGDYYN